MAATATWTVGEVERAFREHGPFLHATARRLCGNTSDAQDLVQDTLERAVAAVKRGETPVNVRAWLTSILYNLFIDRHRAARRAPTRDAVEPEELPAPPPATHPAWLDITTEQLLAAVEKLPEEFRTTYRLHELEGRSYQEIAEKLGIPRPTVGTRLVRARQRLKALLLPLAAGGEDAT